MISSFIVNAIFVPYSSIIVNIIDCSSFFIIVVHFVFQKEYASDKSFVDINYDNNRGNFLGTLCNRKEWRGWGVKPQPQLTL